ncbi:hypothetical protein NBRC116594_01810 [Shimia sp. NS0008-38b]
MANARTRQLVLGTFAVSLVATFFVGSPHLIEGLSGSGFLFDPTTVWGVDTETLGPLSTHYLCAPDALCERTRFVFD